MIVYAAIDLRGSRVVQLEGGRTDRERVSWPDPVGVARRWIADGFRALHVVDLDGALGTGNNESVITNVLEASSVRVQVGGGVRQEKQIAALLEAGAARVVVGTRAVEDVVWRTRVANRFRDRLVVAADMREGHVVTGGWTRDTGLAADRFLASLESETLAGVMITDVSREGSMQGVDVRSFEKLVASSPHPLIAAGGIRDINDLRELANAGVSAAIIGMALYTGNIQPDVVVREFTNE